MTKDRNNELANESKMKILSTLQEVKSPYGFIEIKNKTGLHQKTLSKYLNEYHKNNFIKKGFVRQDVKSRKFSITKEGYDEYRRLLTEDKIVKWHFKKFPYVDTTATSGMVNNFLVDISTSAKIPLTNKQRESINEKMMKIISPVASLIPDNPEVMFIVKMKKVASLEDRDKEK